MATKFGQKNPWPECNALLGQGYVGVSGVNQGSYCLTCPMATKFDRKNPWPKCNALLGSKVMQESAGVNQRSNCLKMSYGFQIWYEEPLTRAKGIAGIKGHAVVSQGQPQVKLLGNPQLPSHLVTRTPDQSATQCWGQNYELLLRALFWLNIRI